jgi:hypothetical protein
VVDSSRVGSVTFAGAALDEHAGTRMDVALDEGVTCGGAGTWTGSPATVVDSLRTSPRAHRADALAAASPEHRGACHGSGELRETGDSRSGALVDLIASATLRVRPRNNHAAAGYEQVIRRAVGSTASSQTRTAIGVIVGTS